MVKELVKISEKRRSTGESRAGEVFEKNNNNSIYLQSLTRKTHLPF